MLAYIPDLMFGSGVVTSLGAAGHNPVLVGDPQTLAGELPGSELVIVDLTADAGARIREVQKHVLPTGVPTLAFYSHVEADVRAEAERAGFDLVVPRSRMAREGVSLVERFSAG